MREGNVFSLSVCPREGDKIQESCPSGHGGTPPDIGVPPSATGGTPPNLGLPYSGHTVYPFPAPSPGHRGYPPEADLEADREVRLGWRLSCSDLRLGLESDCNEA